MVFFAPGCVIGLHLGVMVESGFLAPIERTLNDPIGSAQFFAILVCICVALTVLWRLPRRWLIGRHRVRWYGSLLAGTVMVGGPVAILSLLGRLSMLPAGSPATPRVITTIVGLVAIFTVLSIEIEAAIGNRARKE